MSAPFAWDESHPPDARALAATDFIDYQSETIQQTLRAHTHEGMSDAERAIALFTHVRDAVRYDPYRITLDPAHYKASRALEVGYGFCVPKAITYTALLRAAGIPALLGFADVTNHLSSEKLLAATRSDVFAYHGYSVVWLGGRWVKATPTFNRSLSERAGVPVLDFDGVNDALLSPYDNEGKLHMEYLVDRGWHHDFDLDAMIATFRELYPHWFERPKFEPQTFANSADLGDGARFEDEVTRRS